MKINNHYVFQHAGTLKWCVDVLTQSFDTGPQAEWFALTGETLSAAEAAERIAMATKLGEKVSNMRAALGQLLAAQQAVNVAESQLWALDIVQYSQYAPTHVPLQAEGGEYVTALNSGDWALEQPDIEIQEFLTAFYGVQEALESIDPSLTKTLLRVAK